MVVESSFFDSFKCLHEDKSIGCWYGSKQVNCRVPTVGKQSIAILTEITGGLKTVEFSDAPELRPEKVRGKTHNYVCSVLGKKIHGKKWKGSSKVI